MRWLSVQSLLIGQRGKLQEEKKQLKLLFFRVGDSA